MDGVREDDDQKTGASRENIPLKETSRRSYAIRTRWNVRDSDGTLVVVLSEISSGTKLTIDCAKQLNKPCQVVHLLPSKEAELFSEPISEDEQTQSVVDWLIDHRIRILNIAGPRGSSDANVYRLGVSLSNKH